MFWVLEKGMKVLCSEGIPSPHPISHTPHPQLTSAE